MFRLVEQTHDEKIVMYLNLTKRELAEMLVNCNEALGVLQRGQSIPPPDIRTTTAPPYGGTSWGPASRSAA